MTPQRRIRALCAGLVVGAAGCAGSQASNATPTRDSTIRLSVKNEFGFPVTVYAIGSGTTWSAGRVMPEAVRNFTVPQAVVANGVVEFVVSGEGDESVRSGPLVVTSGRIVDFTISRPLSTSSAVVRR